VLNEQNNEATKNEEEE